MTDSKYDGFDDIDYLSVETTAQSDLIKGIFTLLVKKNIASKNEITAMIEQRIELRNERFFESLRTLQLDREREEHMIEANQAVIDMLEDYKTGAEKL